MIVCPECGRDLESFVWKYWSGLGSERFELICPKCGNNVVVRVRLSFDVTMS